jgi:hypothetical protein
MSEILTLEQVAQAAAEGKDLEFRHKGRPAWHDAIDDDWALSTLAKYEFRLKPPPRRDFAGAISWLLEGKKIRRPHWNDGYSWSLVEGILRPVSTTDPLPDRMEVTAIVGRLRLAATDWEVAPE